MKQCVEGFELSVSRPRVIFKEDDKGNKLEPFEDATIDVDEEYSSSVIDSMNKRKAEMLDMRSCLLYTSDAADE